MKSSSAFCAALAVCALLLSFASVSGQNTAYSPDSDGGGTSDLMVSCNEFQLSGGTRVLIGIAGGAGQWVDWVQGICVRILHDGTWVGAESTTGQAGNSGTPFALRCPANHAVSGLSGRSGTLLDRLEVRCRPLGNAGMFSGSAVLARTSSGTTAAGGTGGSGWGPINCESDRPASVLRARRGAVMFTPTVEKIALRCHAPSPVRVGSISGSFSFWMNATPPTLTVNFTDVLPTAQTVTLTSSNTNVVGVPSSITVASGQKSGGVAIQVKKSPGGCALISASSRGAVVTYPIVVHPLSTATLTLAAPDAALRVGNTHTATIRAPTTSGTIRLSSSNANIARVASAVTLSGLSPEVTFPIDGVSPGCAIVSATLDNQTARRAVYVVQ